MKEFDIIVNKILYQNKATAYAVFNGVALKWAPRKKQFIPTRENHTFVGYFYCLFLGDRFHVEAEERANKLYGTQYIVLSSKREEPASEIEIRNFLLKNVKGMTPKRVEKVMAAYGLDAINALRKDAHAYDFLGIDPNIAGELYSSFMQNKCFEDTLVWLQVHTLDCRYALPLHQKYKDAAILTLQDNPYIPYIDGIYDFKTADRLYVDSGKPLDSPKRCLYTTLATLRMDADNNGNVFTRQNKLAEKMMRFLTETSKTKDMDAFPFTEDMLHEAVAALENNGYIVIDSFSGETLIYLKDNFYSEKKISECLHGFMTEPKRIAYYPPDTDQFLTRYQAGAHITLAPAQLQAVKTALSSPVSIISGGPGTGKTQTINTIMAAIRELSPNAGIRACAPTGKAAIRITELTGVRASTIHRTLGIGKYDGELKGGELSCDFLFVDEFSMVDVQLCAKLFDAMNTCGRIILVGDYNQLPSVGPGLVLRDLINCGAVPVTILNQIFRQNSKSRIIENAHRIIHQTPGKASALTLAKKPGEDFYFVSENDPQKVLEKVKAALTEIKTAYGYGIEQVQILSPVRFGDLGVENLNYELQKAINPNPVSLSFEDKEYRLGDKVTHIKNNYELKVFNGEVGVISDINYAKDKALKVTYPDRDVWYPFQALPELELAYALTVHKLQGSEYPVIILPVHELQGKGLSKNLLYTALTRAKKMVVIIGSASALQTGLRRETVIERESNLVNRIKLFQQGGKI